MTSFMFIISFLLHTVTIMLVIQLYKQIQLKKQENTADIFDIFDNYLEEIRLENKRLQDELLTMSSQSLHSLNETSKNVNKQENQQDDSGDENEDSGMFIPPIENKELDSVQASRQAKILQLYDQGLSEEAIARQLACGKTEVLLNINLNAKRSRKA